jgi:hypothetical protein
MRVGWMKKDFPLEKVSCGGCQDIENCEYGIKECCIQHAIAHCGSCAQFPCGKINHALQITDSNMEKFRAILSVEEYSVFKRAFFEKRENLTRFL